MSLLWEDRSPEEPQRRREPEPQPTRPQQRRLSPSSVLAIQQGAGNRAATALLNRFKDRSDLGKDLVEFDESDTLPNMFGKLTSDPGFEYKPRFERGERIYERAPKGAAFKVAKVDPLEKEKREREQLKEKLATAQSTLFGQDFGGDKEGTFEYVANYLYGEVFLVSKDEAQKIWDRVYTVEEPPSAEPRLKRKELHGKRKLLSDMIDIGLDANWKKVPVQELVKTTVEGGAMPGKDMQTTVWTDYLAASNGTTKPMKAIGVGFHTTDGPPGAVAKAKKDGGWGGVTRPITVDFFRKRYALDQTGWNPLGAWLAKAGPTFRKGIKDNELLSTVSVATATHGSVRFPLADRKRNHVTEKNKEDKDAFKMEVYMYAVVVREGYATFASQGKNAFGEIATGDIPIEDIIGWTKITRWHDYEDAGKTVPATADFYYEMTQLQRNDKFTAGELNDRVFGIAHGEIEKERALSAKKYTAAT